MKTKSISIAIIFIYTAFVASILFLISCGGCGSGKANKTTMLFETNNADRISYPPSNEIAPLEDSITNTYNKERIDHHPQFDERLQVKYLDDITDDFQGVKRISEYPEIKIIFPNGKVLSNIKDAALLNEVPKEARVFYQSSEKDLCIKELDLKKLVPSLRNEWLGNMKRSSHVKQSDFGYMFMRSDFLEISETPGMVCLATYALVWSDMGELIGRIAHLDIYDYEGKLVLQIPMYDYGGEHFVITKDQKYLLSIVNGSRLGDGDFSCGYLSPKINIYTMEDGKFYTQLNMPCCEFTCSSRKSNITFSINGAKFSGVIDIEKRIIKIIENVQEILDGGPVLRVEDGFITKDGRLWKYQRYSFEEWNSIDLSIFEESKF
jgi:hypothetical protein